MAKIHPSAIVAPQAELAEDVVVEAFAVVDGDVKVGAGCRIDTCVRLHSGVRLAENVHVFHGAALGGEPQDLKFGGEQSELFVGAGTVIREFVTLSRGTMATGRTTIGKNCLLMAYTHVAHDCAVGDNVILVNSVNLAGHVEVEDFAIIGGIVPVHQFVRIGRHSMVGGGLRVPKDVPPYIMAGGQPLRYYGLNSVGLRRRGFPADVRSALKKAYYYLFQSEMNIRQAVDRIQRELGQYAEVQHLVDFVNKSKRGLLPGHRVARHDEEQDEI